jgi:hypothetical protein
VAEKVMEWEFIPEGSVIQLPSVSHVFVKFLPDNKGETIEDLYKSPNSQYWRNLHGVPHYSTRIQDAWQVVEKFVMAHIYKQREDYYTCTIPWNGELHEAGAATAPLAICLAALKAVE